MRDAPTLFGRGGDSRRAGGAARRREHREDIASWIYYRGSNEFLKAGKRRPTGDTALVATSSEANDLRRKVQALKEVAPT